MRSAGLEFWSVFSDSAMFGASFSNAYEERARIKKTAKAAGSAARAAKFGADVKSSGAKYPFAVRLNEKQLLSHIENVLKVFADPGVFLRNHTVQTPGLMQLVCLFIC